MNESHPRTRFGMPLLRVGATTAAILMIPVIAMRFTAEVDWGLGDFVVAALLLMLAGSAIVFGTRAVRSRGGKLATVFGIGGLLALVWAQLAVGLLG